jgi:hypothetical protein
MIYRRYLMKGLFFGIVIALLIVSGCAEGSYVGKKINSLMDKSAISDNNLAIQNEQIPRRDDIINGCRVIDEEGEYVLINDINNARDEICINIQADNVIFDCQGHTINGDFMYGIYAVGNENNPLTNLTIKNCNLNGWNKNKGIYVENVEDSKIINNKVITNNEEGYKLEHPNNKFNLNDTAYDLNDKLTEEQLPTLLKNDIFLDNVGENRGETGYTQELIFTDRSSNSEKSIWYIYDQNTEDNNNPMGDYVYLSKTSNAWAWIYNFDLDYSIDVDNPADLENTQLNLLGREFIISNIRLTGNKVSRLTLVNGDDEIVLEDEEEVVINDNHIPRSKVMFESNNGLDQFKIFFKPDDKIYISPGEGYEDPIFKTFKLLFKRVNEDNPEEVLINASERKAEITATNKYGDETTWTIAYATDDRDIIPGSDDEPFIALEDDYVTADSIDEEELSGINNVRFLLSRDDESHIIRIKEIDTLNNKTTFYDETTDTEYADQEFISERSTEFNFLDMPFSLTFSHINAQITFDEINDKGPSYFLRNGGNITFWRKWSEQDQTTPYYITFGEVDNEVESNIPLNVIRINLSYSSYNEEINLQAVESNNNFVHRTTSLKQKDRSDTKLKAGKTIYGTYVEQVTPTDSGTDTITIRTPDIATYAEVFIIPLAGGGIGIELSNSNNNLIADNTFCYNNKDIKIGENSDNNEFLYNQFENVEGLNLEGIPCGIEEHKIQLNQGWNLVSSYLIPYYLDIEAVLGPLARIGEMTTAKDSHGRFWIPEEDFNSMVDWNPQEGYQVYVKDPVILTVKGEEHINPRIELHEGWNTIAYPLTEAHRMRYIIDNILNPLIEDDILFIVKNGEGKFFLPSRNFNNIKEMKPGEGYMINVNEDSAIDFGE